MKRIIMIGIAVAALLSMQSCKEIDETANDGKTLIIQDSVGNVFPTCQSIKVIIDEDHSHMRLIIGDAAFYNALPEEKTKKAIDFGKMVTRIYGKDNLLTKGEVTVTKNVRNTDAAPKDGITTPIPFADLKK